MRKKESDEQLPPSPDSCLSAEIWAPLKPTASITGKGKNNSDVALEDGHGLGEREGFCSRCQEIDVEAPKLEVGFRRLGSCKIPMIFSLCFFFFTISFLANLFLPFCWLRRFGVGLMVNHRRFLWPSPIFKEKMEIFPFCLELVWGFFLMLERDLFHGFVHL